MRGVLFYLKPVRSFYWHCTDIIRGDILCILWAAAQRTDLIAVRHSWCKLMQLHYWSGLLLVYMNLLPLLLLASTTVNCRGWCYLLHCGYFPVMLSFFPLCLFLSVVIHVVTPPLFKLMSSPPLILSFHPNVLPLPWSLVSIASGFCIWNAQGLGSWVSLLTLMKIWCNSNRNTLSLLAVFLQLAVTSFRFLC